MKAQDKCRLSGHQWDEYNPGKSWRGAFHFDVLHFRCLQCTACRHDSFDMFGKLMCRSYDYPEGYGYAKDEKPTKEQLRLAAHPRRKRGHQSQLQH